MSKPTRTWRVVALAPAVAGGLLFATSGLAQAQEPPVEEPTTTTTIAEAPKPTIETVTPRPGALTVKFAKAADSNPLFHILSAKVDDAVKAITVVPGDVTMASLSGLTNGTEYDVTVSSIDLAGFGTSSAPATGTPVADGSAVTAPVKVQDVEVVRSKYSATVSWTAPATDGGSPIKAYVVTAVDTSTGELAEWRTLGADVRSASLAPLQHGIVYDVSVFAVSGAGFGALDTHEVVGSNALANPLNPVVPWATAYVDDEGMVVANWGAATEKGLPVERYDVVIVQDEELVGWAIAKPESRSVKVEGLDETEDAEIFVFATSALGFGPTVSVEIPAAPAEAEEG